MADCNMFIITPFLTIELHMVVEFILPVHIQIFNSLYFPTIRPCTEKTERLHRIQLRWWKHPRENWAMIQMAIN